MSLSSYQKILLKRLKTLVIPYLWWNLAALIANILAGNITWNSINISDLLILFVKSTPSLGTINHPLWYLRDLFVFVLVSPICYIIGKSVFKHLFLLVLMLLWFLDIGGTMTYNGFGGLLFFYSGMLLNINGYDIYSKVKAVANKVHPYIIIYIICSILCVSYRDVLSGICLKLCTLAGIILFVSLLERYKDRLMKTLNWTLSKNSFFIYCMHGIFTGFISGILTKAAFSLNSPLYSQSFKSS